MTIILYSRPNLYALVKSCINVNHYVLLVWCHLKYVGFTKFTKFWGEVKNGPSLWISKNKKSFQLQGGGASPPGPRPGALPPDPAGAPPPGPRAFPQLQICHYTTGRVPNISRVFNCLIEAGCDLYPYPLLFTYCTGYDGHSRCVKWIIMDTGTSGSRKRKAYTIKVELTAIVHTVYRKSLLLWYGKLTMF